MLLTIDYNFLNLIFVIIGIMITLLTAIIIPLIVYVVGLHTKVAKLLDFKETTQMTLEEMRSNMKKQTQIEKDTYAAIMVLQSKMDTPLKT